MPDRKNAIENLGQNIRWIEEIECHQFPGWANVTMAMAMRGAAELLKEQETVEPIYQGDDSYACDNCGETVGWEELDVSGIYPVKYKYCPGCGRKVKWDADT